MIRTVFLRVSVLALATAAGCTAPAATADMDAAQDSGHDAASVDAPRDTGGDAAAQTDTGIDAIVANDVGIDAGVDVGVDVGIDAWTPSPTGSPCATGAGCASGFCVDGVCCGSACTGLCQACSAARRGAGSDGVCGAIATGADPDNECPAQAVSTCGNAGGCNGAGGCATYPTGTVCVAASCAGAGMLTRASTCTAPLTCTAPAPPTQSCGAYACNGTACRTMCQVSTDCASGNYCNTVTHLCAAMIGIGQPCASDAECTSTHCADGVCCQVACGGQCQACSMLYTFAASGQCASANPGTNPHGSCPGAQVCRLGGGCM